MSSYRNERYRPCIKKVVGKMVLGAKVSKWRRLIMRLIGYIDVFGRIGLSMKFEDTEANQGLNELLNDLINENFYGDTYKEYEPGFYWIEFEEVPEVTDHMGALFSESFLQVSRIIEIEEKLLNQWLRGQLPIMGVKFQV